jgi:HAE1 family hydrophobic/amphiphilic exporter-1
MGDVISDIEKWFKTDIKLPPGIGYVFVGQAENFQEMGRSMGIAFGLGILFIYLVLASLYESFIIPLTIMLALPLAVCGSIVGLFIMHESVNLFSLLGIVMLLGVASKNSILLVDHAVKKMAEGANSVDAMLDAGRKRLRPILMTTMALIAGIMPIAIGLNEASKQRTCMGVAIIGGLVSSTLLTLVVVPAAFILIEGGRSRLLKLWNRKDASSGETHKVA